MASLPFTTVQATYHFAPKDSSLSGDELYKQTKEF